MTDVEKVAQMALTWEKQLAALLADERAGLLENEKVVQMAELMENKLAASKVWSLVVSKAVMSVKPLVVSKADL